MSGGVKGNMDTELSFKLSSKSNAESVVFTVSFGFLIIYILSFILK